MDYKKLMDMTGKVCIVTGGTGYLGTENVKILKDFGATVVVADIRAAEERWANAPQPVGDLFVECDVSASESIRACFQKVYDTYGHIDVLINCASYGAGYGKGSWSTWKTTCSARAWTVLSVWCSAVCVRSFRS